MATVIDSLLIELGLDTSKFDAAQKKSVEQLRKFDDQAGKSSKNAQRGAKDMGEGFEKARDALISFGTAIFGTAGFANFVGTMTTANAALGRNANLFSMSARELDAWGSVLKTVGGDADQFQSSLQNLQSGVANIKLGNAAIMTPLARLGALSSIDVNKGTVDIYKLADALKAFKKENGEQLTYTLAQQLGINKETYMVLSQGADVVRKLYDEQYKLSGVTADNTQKAQKLQEQWGLTTQAMSGAKNQIMDQLYPALNLAATGTQKFFEGFVDADKKLDGFASQLLLIGAAAATLKGALSSLKVVGISVGEGLAAAFSKVFGAAALLFHSGELNKGEDEWLAAQRAKRGGAGGAGGGVPRNIRNNNPGNIEYGKFAIEHGATGSDGRFAIFPSMKAGEDAMAALLMSYAKGGTNTISSIVRKWSPAGENGAANTNAYIADVAKRTGIDPNKVLSNSELLSVQKAMSAHEGTIGSGATAPAAPNNNAANVQTNIQTVNVQTQATDANGIARDMNKAFQNNSLINYGMAGNR